MSRFLLVIFCMFLCILLLINKVIAGDDNDDDFFVNVDENGIGYASEVKCASENDCEAVASAAASSPPPSSSSSSHSQASDNDLDSEFNDPSLHESWAPRYKIEIGGKPSTNLVDYESAGDDAAFSVTVRLLSVPSDVELSNDQQEHLRRYQEAAKRYNEGVQAHARGGTNAVFECSRHFLEAVRIYPRLADAWYNMAIIALGQGKTSVAQIYAERALAVDAQRGSFHQMLANTLLSQLKSATKDGSVGVTPELSADVASRRLMFRAAAHLQQAARLDASLLRAPSLITGLVTVLLSLGHAARAIDWVERAVKAAAAAAGDVGAQAELLALASHLYRKTKDGERAIEALEKAIKLSPNTASYYNELGDLKKHTDFPHLVDVQGAAAAFARAVQLDPSNAAAHYSLGSSYSMAGQLDVAIEQYSRALSLDPSLSVAFTERFHLRASACDWRHRRSEFERYRDMVDAELRASKVPSITPWHVLGYEFSADDKRRVAAAYAQSIVDETRMHYPHARARFTPRCANDDAYYREEVYLTSNSDKVYTIDEIGWSTTDEVRVGVVTADIGGTNVGHSIVGWLQHQSIHHLNVRLFIYTPTLDDGSGWYRANARAASDEARGHRLRFIGNLSSEAAAALIYADNIDVLVNLNGFTKYSRNDIFALRPAPVQVVYKGYPSTMGSAELHDYIVGDSTLTPLTHAHKYAEKLVLMPHSFFLTSYPEAFPHNLAHERRRALRRQDYGLPPSSSSTFIFCNFNHLYKVTPDVFDTWMRIMQQVNDSVLWMMKLPKEAAGHLRREAEARGVDARRLVFSDFFPLADHLSVKSQCDLFLDTRLFNAHGTATDALWAGVPLLTIAGDFYPARAAASHLTTLGVDEELVTTSLEAYEATAVRLATLPRTKLAALRRRLESARLSSSLFNTKQWTLDFDRAMRLLALLHRSRRRPSHVVVPRNESADLTTPSVGDYVDVSHVPEYYQ